MESGSSSRIRGAAISTGHGASGCAETPTAVPGGPPLSYELPNLVDNPSMQNVAVSWRASCLRWCWKGCNWRVRRFPRSQLGKSLNYSDLQNEPALDTAHFVWEIRAAHSPRRTVHSIFRDYIRLHLSAFHRPPPTASTRPQITQKKQTNGDNTR
jgi:hypothetical protein